jgi:hypothetical protein
MKFELSDWIDEVKKPEYVCYIKRLSGNDTLANGTHQAGPYIPKKILLQLFPNSLKKDEKNPDVWFDLYIDSHSIKNNVRAIWYNNKFYDDEGTRNEARLTNFGGKSSPLLEPDSTGALTVFAFNLNNKCETEFCKVWVCNDETEEELVENWIGPIDPGQWELWVNNSSNCFKETANNLHRAVKAKTCWLDKSQIPPTWLNKYPSGLEIIKKTIELRPDKSTNVDTRILERRKCEFNIFKSLEEAVEFPKINSGFENIEDFLSLAQSILQRRKSRSGRSLELHTKEILNEEGFRENIDFNFQPESENGKKPDFLFPTEKAYKDKRFPPERLKMLAVKTTCKDRWRQILNEAERIPKKHLLTIQEGISENQFQEMQSSGVALVVPKPLFSKYSKKIRPQLISLESFFNDLKRP